MRRSKHRPVLGTGIRLGGGVSPWQLRIGQLSEPIDCHRRTARGMQAGRAGVVTLLRLVKGDRRLARSSSWVVKAAPRSEATAARCRDQPG